MTNPDNNPRDGGAVEAAITPEPWECDGLTVSAHGRGIIAEIPTPRTGGVFECNANARAIAALPDALAALKAAVESVREPTGIGLGAGGLEFRYPPWRAQAIAALKSAGVIS